MKKALLFVCLLLVLCLSGCDKQGGVYKQAQTALENGDYVQVDELLDSIPDYQDVDSLRTAADGLRTDANVAQLKKIVDISTSPECCEVASDGSYIKIDTNPDNEKDYYNSEYSQTVQEINKALSFNDSLWEKMSQTRSLDGRLTDENDTFNVSWTYHPDNGMNVLYERK